MYEPLKNPGDQPWKNYVLQHETTAFHHKSAEIISREVQLKSTGGQTPKKGLGTGKEEFYCIRIQTTLSSDFKISCTGFCFLLKGSLLLKGAFISVSSFATGKNLTTKYI